jgi:AmmeMemoRadiSam system protein B
MIRQAVAAGRFYPGSADELREMMAALIDKTAKKEAAIGLLMPHAGYPYSGAVAGAAISRVKLKDTFIIMGPSHTGVGRPFSIMTEGAWQTPLGDVDIDPALGEKLLAVSDYLQEDKTAHLYEHAVEVQLPFLQYLKPDVRIVPIILAYAPAEVYKAIGKDIARAIKETGGKAVIIASGDMTHYEPQATAEEKDKQAIEAMLKLDADELTRRYQELKISMCAYGPAVSLITAAKELGATGAELVKYQTSGDATGDYSSVVGYAGIIIKGGGG